MERADHQPVRRRSGRRRRLTGHLRRPGGGGAGHGLARIPAEPVSPREQEDPREDDRGDGARGDDEASKILDRPYRSPWDAELKSVLG